MNDNNNNIEEENNIENENNFENNNENFSPQIDLLSSNRNQQYNISSLPSDIRKRSQRI